MTERSAEFSLDANRDELLWGPKARLVALEFLRPTNTQIAKRIACELVCVNVHSCVLLCERVCARGCALACVSHIAQAHSGVDGDGSDYVGCDGGGGGLLGG